MSATEVLFKAGITRVLMVDDDLRTKPTITDVIECAPRGQHSVKDILEDPDHDATERLVELLQEKGLPHTTLEELFQGLAEDDILERCEEDLKVPYNSAIERLRGFQEPLQKIQSWVHARKRIGVVTSPKIPELKDGEFYDLLIVDYYLVDNQSAPTRAFITRMIEAHRECEKPLLIILMSSHKEGVTKDLSEIRDEVGASASRFRVLVKPIATHGEPDAVVKERWIQALTQLAHERALINPMEQFVKAWQEGLKKATDTMIKRLYELDASAYAILAATAEADSMSIEEYMADVLAKRVSAETEQHAEVSEHTSALQTALVGFQSTVGPTINQGVEVKDAQHAIRSLMSDVVWHRSLWYEPKADVPPKGIRKETADGATNTLAPATDVSITVVGEIENLGKVAQAEFMTALVAQPVDDPVHPGANEPVASAPIAKIADQQEIAAREDGKAVALVPVTTGITDDRLRWMKRYLRFGTVLREKTGLKRYFVNITQACDVQNVRFSAANDYHYLFMRGDKLPVDRVSVGEKIFESQYYAQSAAVDEFHSFHWNLRQPFTPSMAEVLESLEQYSIEGQLRNESAYAVLAKFVSQATRVAQVRMPKIYRCPVTVFLRHEGQWVHHVPNTDAEIFSSSWERKTGVWCNQFGLDDAFSMVSTINGTDDAAKAKMVAALGKSTQLDIAKKPAAVKKVDGDRLFLARLKGDMEMDVKTLIQQLSSHDELTKAKDADVIIVVRSAKA